MFHEQIADITADVPSWLIITVYLAVGFGIGFFAIKDGKCESPVETLFGATLGAGALVIIAMPFIIIWGIFALIVRILGIEASQSDSHGV